MKRNKLLIPLTTLVGAVGAIAPSICLTSCQNNSQESLPPTAILASRRFKFTETPVVRKNEAFTCTITSIVPGAAGLQQQDLIVYNNHVRTLNFYLQQSKEDEEFIYTLTFTEGEKVNGDIYICIEDPLFYYLDVSGEISHKYNVIADQELPHYGSVWSCEIHDTNPDQDQYEQSLPDNTHITILNNMVPLQTSSTQPIRCEHVNHSVDGVSHWYIKISLPAEGPYSKALGDIIVRIAPPPTA
ncbi:MAG: hypothetical protein ACOQNV_00595 [Mycoplasmoidaceae bacterium]